LATSSAEAASVYLTALATSSAQAASVYLATAVGRARREEAKMRGMTPVALTCEQTQQGLDQDMKTGTRDSFIIT
jgi:DNA-binding phage protein